MPTGYTYGIIEGKIKTFPEFAKLCMRAFGATVHMRGSDIEAKYEPQLPAEKYYDSEIEKYNQILLKANSSSDEELINERIQELKTNKEYHLTAIEKAKSASLKLIPFLEQINNWNPPTPEHEEVKNFMLEQIKETLKRDGDYSYHENAILELNNTGKIIDATQIRKENIELAQKNISYFIKSKYEDIERCKKANQWVEDFLNSLT